METHFLQVLFPSISQRQLQFSSPEEPVPPALFLLDGHPTRRKKKLWRRAAELNIDVIILPIFLENFTISKVNPGCGIGTWNFFHGLCNSKLL
jgi:hypothetical protein